VHPSGPNLPATSAPGALPSNGNGRDVLANFQDRLDVVAER
jgi:hypothetical protein